MTGPVRAGAGWLALREPADAAARAHDLVDVVRASLPPDRAAVIHDLGSGTGSMARWLAGQLTGPQHWVMYDRDAELLALALADPPDQAADGAPVTVETRQRDITRLSPRELADAALVTASAVLDMMTTEEVGRLVASSVSPGCPVLVTLTVVGRVELTPGDPLDRSVAAAFDDHQRRTVGDRRLLGPDAVDAAVEELTRLGAEVLVRPSPWRLGPGQAALTAAWFTGWLAAACEQRPELLSAVAPYAKRRWAEIADGRLSVTVHHQDLLALPR